MQNAINVFVYVCRMSTERQSRRSSRCNVKEPTVSHNGHRQQQQPTSTHSVDNRKGWRGRKRSEARKQKWKKTFTCWPTYYISINICKQIYEPSSTIFLQLWAHIFHIYISEQFRYVLPLCVWSMQSGAWLLYIHSAAASTSTFLSTHEMEERKYNISVRSGRVYIVP